MLREPHTKDSIMNKQRATEKIAPVRCRKPCSKNTIRASSALTTTTAQVKHRKLCAEIGNQDDALPGPAVVPPTAANALLKKVAMFCSLAVGGSPPTYILLACRVACCEGG